MIRIFFLIPTLIYFLFVFLCVFHVSPMIERHAGEMVKLNYQNYFTCYISLVYTVVLNLHEFL